MHFSLHSFIKSRSQAYEKMNEIMLKMRTNNKIIVLSTKKIWDDGTLVTDAHKFSNQF